MKARSEPTLEIVAPHILKMQEEILREFGHW